MAWYDRSAKWLIGHYGKSLLWLVGEQREIVSCKAVQAEVVLPTKLPDGLLEVKVAQSNEMELHLLEVFVYPDRRAVEQIVHDLELVHADRGQVPEISVLTLRPKGRYRIPNEVTLTSRRGTTSLRIQWSSKELWRVPAADLLARDDPGLIPWVPLCQTQRLPKSLLTECRRRIEQSAPPEERESLLATTYVYAHLRYEDQALLRILGDRKMLVETPLIQQFINEGKVEGKKEGTVQAILTVIESRFGSVPESLVSKLQEVAEQDRLSELLRLSAVCKTVKSLEQELG